MSCNQKAKSTGNLTEGGIAKTLIFFALPYLFACFMQSFYGMVDLYVVGRFNTSISTNAVSIGSQVMHMITVIIVGLTMGVTVMIGRAIGAKNEKAAKKTVRAALVFFSITAAIMTILLFIFTKAIVKLMLTPAVSVEETTAYLRICFLGIPFITACNVFGSIFRGAGDSKTPMYFVGIACAVNVIFDFVLVGGFSMSSEGAALATVFGQAVSAILSIAFIKAKGMGSPFSPASDNRLKSKPEKSPAAKSRANMDHEMASSKVEEDKNPGIGLRDILYVGVPVALQDGLIQVAFVIITIIANSRGFVASTAVGIVEKLISFMFLVPSAFLSAISAITAQNMGAGKPERAHKALKIGMSIAVAYGLLCALYNQILPQTLIGFFTRDTAVLSAACEYMKPYSFDCVFAAIHFCFSGYFCGAGRSSLSFIHNIASIVIIRIPGAYLACRLWPESLYPMGWAAPFGSLLSAALCTVFFLHLTGKSHPFIR